MKARRLLAAATIELWGGSLPVRIRKRLLANAVRNRYASTAALRRAIAGQIRGRRQDG